MVKADNSPVTCHVPLKTVIIGIIAGLASGLFGIGGGVIFIPAMVYLLDVPQHTAQGTALLVILPTALSGALHYYTAGYLNLEYLVWIASGSMLGVLLGSNVAHELSPKVLRKLFGMLMLVAAVKMFLG